MWITALLKTVGIDVGVELDATHFNPDTPGRVEMDATYFGIKVLARLPMGVTPDLLNERWFPYIGIGGGGRRLAMQAPEANEGRSTAPAFQELGGIKVFVTKHSAAFAEGKFIYASHAHGVQVSDSIDLTLKSVQGAGTCPFTS